LGDETVGITALDCLVDRFAVESRSVGAGCRFEVMGDAACSGEAVLAEGALDLRASVCAGVKVHLQVISVVECTFTILAIMKPVSECVHVLVRSILTVEHRGTRVAFEMRFPVSNSIHMLGGRMLAGELAVAALTLKARSPVLKSIHVLVYGTLAAEYTVTRVALVTGVVAIHFESVNKFNGNEG